jgi:hypothetical protein
MKTYLPTIVAVALIMPASTGVLCGQTEVAAPTAAIEKVRHHGGGFAEFEFTLTNSSNKEMAIGNGSSWRFEVAVTDAEGVTRDLRLIYPFRMTLEAGDSHTFQLAICPWEGKPAWDCHSKNVWWCLPPRPRQPAKPGEEFHFRHALPPIADFSLRDGFGVFPIEVECRFTSDSEPAVTANVTIRRQLTPEALGIIMAKKSPMVAGIDCHTPNNPFPLLGSGDRFHEFNGRPIHTTQDLRQALRFAPRGRPIEVVIEPDAYLGTGHRRTVTVTLPEVLRKSVEGSARDKAERAEQGGAGQPATHSESE